MKRAWVHVLIVSALAAPAARAEESKGKLVLNGVFTPASLSFSESRRYTEFAEESTIEAQYRGKSAPGFDLGIEYRFLRHVGAAVGVSVVDRKETGSLTSGIPHPLYFERLRQVRADLNGMNYKETAFHVDLVVTGRRGSLEYAAFAGASFFKVQADLVDRLQFTQSYPFETVTLTGTPTARFDDRPVGFNGGASIEFHLANHFGLGAHARYSRAKVELVPSQGNSVSFDAGGLQVAAGARIYF